VLEQVTVTRYATPLREGGSLPAIVEADNLGTYGTTGACVRLLLGRAPLGPEVIR
jgi:hypothetical protein